MQPVKRGWLVLAILFLAFGVRVAAATYWHQQTLATERVFSLG